MNGAHALIRTLVDSGVDVCFANPGTSEMHFVAALDDVPEMRAVLGLFEGVVTGAADGYGRMADKPAATLLHLGPGLGNGIANLHNARRAHTPIVNIVGDHATYHHQFDAPLDSDIDALASNVSGWIRTSRRSEDVAGDAADAVVAALRPPGQVATLILPADVSWLEGASAVGPRQLADADRGRRRGRGRRGQGAPVGRAGRDHVGQRSRARAWAPGRRAASPRRRAHSCSARRSPPGSSAAPGSHRSIGSATWPSSRWRSSRGRVT